MACNYYRCARGSHRSFQFHILQSGSSCRGPDSPKLTFKGSEVQERGNNEKTTTHHHAGPPRRRKPKIPATPTSAPRHPPTIFSLLETSHLYPDLPSPTPL